ncbi:hypothetical protein [Phytohabitans kaempferiae]|uniref:Cholesterol esterase n=1 Tax=Phytohabitans kaempferiae TaxID=1620943 RepID=A0ABV6MFL1_9ACTN
MPSISGLPRRLLGFLTTAFAATVLATTLAAAPAQAAWSSPYAVDLQLRSYTSTGAEFLVGRLVGTLQFDSGNSQYLLSLIMCRQSSYVNPNVRILINGVTHQWFSPSDNTRRPESCGGGHGLSGVISGAYAYGGVIPSITVSFAGIHFDYSTAKDITRSAFYDNPYN